MYITGIKLRESLAFINVIMHSMEDLFVFDNGEFIVSKKHRINIKSRFCPDMLSECYSNVTVKSAFKGVVRIRFNFPAMTKMRSHNIFPEEKSRLFMALKVRALENNVRKCSSIFFFSCCFLYFLPANPHNSINI